MQRRRVLQALGVVLACEASRSAAAVHKCAGAAGTVYQDRPCDGGAAGDLGLEDAPLSVLPAPRPARTLERREPVPKPPRQERARRREPAHEGNPAERRHLRVGMTEGEVIARVGPPDLTTISS
jgi:hypothetical protein